MNIEKINADDFGVFFLIYNTILLIRVNPTILAERI